MRVDLKISQERVREFKQRGQWIDYTTNELLERGAREFPNKLALIDRRLRLTYAEYYRRAQKLAARFVRLGLTSDDVIAIQLPNWSEFPIALNAAMLAGVPFCHFHSDFRSREVDFILSFTGASTIVIPREFRRFDHTKMVAELKPNLPNLKHVIVVGDQVGSDDFDLRRFLDSAEPGELSEAELKLRRPHPNDFQRTCFTSGTTGDPKAVVHNHNTTGYMCRLLNKGQHLGPDSRFLIFLPVGLNWGMGCVMQALFAGCTAVFMDIFNAEEALQIIQRERISHFSCAPAHLVSMLNVPNLEKYDLSSLQGYMTGGASCPIEVIREVQKRFPGHLQEMYGMLECGTQSHTTWEDDPEQVCGTVGHTVEGMQNRVVDDNLNDCKPGETGEILTKGPSITLGYYNNPLANAAAFTPDGWFHTGDLATFTESGLLKIVGRKKEMLIRGGANIYPREIEDVLYTNPKILDAAIVGLPDPRLGERVCACIVPKPGENWDFDEMIGFLKGKIATYKLPEFMQILPELPRTPSGKVQKGPMQKIVLEKMGSAQCSTDRKSR